jgi:hypothetical protein
MDRQPIESTSKDLDLKMSFLRTRHLMYVFLCEGRSDRHLFDESNNLLPSHSDQNQVKSW